MIYQNYVAEAQWKLSITDCDGAYKEKRLSDATKWSKKVRIVL